MSDKLKLFAESLFTNHETRMYRKEKDAFLDCCEKEFSKLGYSEVIVKEDRNLLGMTSRNLVVGPLDADILITAHYDTPGRNGFMMILTPIFGGLWGSLLGVALLIVALSFFQQYLDVAINSGAFWVTYLRIGFFLLLAAFFFMKNKHNRNDNTSGVLGVYKIAELVLQSPELKARCAFVLFDHEEVLPGFLGSRAFAKWRKKTYPDKAEGAVINLDCIGLGDILAVVTKKKHERFHEVAEFIQGEGFEVVKVRGGIAGDSDHSSFPNGVSLMCKKNSLLRSTYIPKIHTGRDMVCNLEQVEKLCKAVFKYIGRDSL